MLRLFSMNLINNTDTVSDIYSEEMGDKGWMGRLLLLAPLPLSTLKINL